MSRSQDPRREDFFRIAGVSFFVISTLFFFGPLYLYLTNVGEFEFGLSTVFPFQLLLTLILLAVTLAVLSFLPQRFFRSLAVLAAACGFLFWLQGQVIVWQYGALNGQDIIWSRHVAKGIIDSVIWIVGIALAALFRRQLYPRISRIVFFLIILQAGLLIALFLKHPGAWQAGLVPGNENLRYNFSRDRNVMLLVLDEFQSDVFADIVSQDRDYPAMFDGFTYFRNSIGSYMCTASAIPLIMTGQYFDNTEPRSQYIRRSYSSHSIPERLQANGFRLDMYPRQGFSDTVYLPPSWLKQRHPKSISWRAWIPAQAFLLDITLFRYAPHFIKPLFYQRQDWLLSSRARKLFSDSAAAGPSANKQNVATKSFQGFNSGLVQLNLDFDFVNRFVRQAEAGSPEPVFKYYHWNAVHVPLRFDENFQIVHRESNRASFTSQAKGCLKMVKLILEKMKELNIYDHTQIIILSDHGSGRTPDMFVNPLFNDYSRFLSNGDPYQAFHFSKSRGCTLLLVKPFGAKGDMKISNAPVSQLDIAPTIFKELGIVAPSFSGTAVFSIPEESKRRRFFYAYKWDGDHNDFLQPLVEYRIDGDCWRDDSWDRTGRVLQAP